MHLQRSYVLAYLLFLVALYVCDCDIMDHV